MPATYILKTQKRDWSGFATSEMQCPTILGALLVEELAQQTKSGMWSLVIPLPRNIRFKK